MLSKEKVPKTKEFITKSKTKAFVDENIRLLKTEKMNFLLFYNLQNLQGLLFLNVCLEAFCNL